MDIQEFTEAILDGREDDAIKIVLNSNGVNFGQGIEQPLLNAVVSKAKIGVFEALIKKGANLRAADESGQTALHLACFYSDADVVKFLIRHAPVVDALAEQKDTPLARMLMSDRPDRLELIDALLDAGANLNHIDGYGLPIFHKVVSGRRLDVLEKIIPRGLLIDAHDVGFEKKHALHNVCLAGYTPVFDLLIAAGANPNAKDHRGRTLLYDAAWQGHEDLCERLIALKVPVDEPDCDGMTPLHAAASNGKTGACAILMRAGADPLIKHKGVTASGLAGRKKYPETAHQIKALAQSIAASNAVNEALNAAKKRQVGP
jgi:ankyrin repeat protein